jgi:CubicO group peptidase (beta-lactamase class C family)
MTRLNKYAKYLPTLTAADTVTIRELLSHTSVIAITGRKISNSKP